MSIEGPIGGGLLTCITCRVGFHDSDLQRDHYKSDWHRYNLKRKVVNLPPVTAENFQERVEEQEASQASAGKAIVQYCSTCKKSFGNEKALQNHLTSNKHFQAVKELSGEQEQPETVNGEDTSLVVPVVSNSEEKDEKRQGGKKFPPEPIIPLIKSGPQKMQVDSEDDDEEEGDWEEIEGTPIPINTCLFCEKESTDMDKNLEHMSIAHSFFIPDAEYCVDVEGLLEYLGEKVGEGMVCLWCNEKSRQFYSIQAAQQHMRDKGHCRILHEGESVFEFTDFYDYSSSYPDDAEEKNADEAYQPDPVYFNENMQLVLPSGVTLGHRALKIYYRQYVRPSSQLVQSRQAKRSKLLLQYKAIGYGETSLSAAQQKCRDQRYFKRVRDKYRMKLGISGNSILQKHYRRQVQF